MFQIYKHRSENRHKVQISFITQYKSLNGYRHYAWNEDYIKTFRAMTQKYRLETLPQISPKSKRVLSVNFELSS